jgi:hypothetical protein
VLLAPLGKVLVQQADTTGNPAPLVFKLLCGSRENLCLALDLRSGQGNHNVTTSTG